jgi:hypothetical protein
MCGCGAGLLTSDDTSSDAAVACVPACRRRRYELLCHGSGSAAVNGVVRADWHGGAAAQPLALHDGDMIQLRGSADLICFECCTHGQAATVSSPEPEPEPQCPRLPSPPPLPPATRVAPPPSPMLVPGTPALPPAQTPPQPQWLVAAAAAAAGTPMHAPVPSPQPPPACPVPPLVIEGLATGMMAGQQLAEQQQQAVGQLSSASSLTSSDTRHGGGGVEAAAAAAEEEEEELLSSPSPCSEGLTIGHVSVWCHLGAASPRGLHWGGSSRCYRVSMCQSAEALSVVLKRCWRDHTRHEAANGSFQLSLSDLGGARCGVRRCLPRLPRLSLSLSLSLCVCVCVCVCVCGISGPPAVPSHTISVPLVATGCRGR